MAVARSRDRSGAGSTGSTWSPTTGGSSCSARSQRFWFGALVAAVVLTAAGADRQTGTGTLLGSAVAVAATLLIVQRLAGRNPQSTAEQVGLRGMPVPRAAQLLVPAAAAIAVVVVVWGLLVDVNAALPAPDQITGARPIDRLLDGGQARGAIDVDVGIVAGIVGLGVLGPWLAELVLRGVVLPVLAASVSRVESKRMSSSVSIVCAGGAEIKQPGRLVTAATVALVLTVLAACGGSKTKTVVSTATAPGPTAAAGATEEQPSGTTDDAQTSKERAPTEPLPTAAGGVSVVQGTYKMTVAEESTSKDFDSGDVITWGAVTRCDPECIVELRRENANGGFTTLMLPSLNNTRYGRDGEGSLMCRGRLVPTKTRTSLSVLKVRDEAGIELATEIQGFVRNRFTCSSGVTSTELLRVKGRLQD